MAVLADEMPQVVIDTAEPRLVEPTDGHVRLAGTDILALRHRELRPLRRRMQIVFQDPYASLSPRLQIRRILAEPLLQYRIVTKPEIEAKRDGNLAACHFR